LEDQIAKAKSESKKDQIEKIEEITYNNKTVPLKSERLKQVFKKVESHNHEIQEYWEK
jgi:chorismate mutase